jgi:L-2,4-diaminobutyrate decarboxylase
MDTAVALPIESLRQAIPRDLQNGKAPIAVVASAGTTSTGSIDPLAKIADLCRRFDLWLQVDGAYGAFAAMANSRGVSRLGECRLNIPRSTQVAVPANWVWVLTLP